jgi:hypothetical protein
MKNEKRKRIWFWSIFLAGVIAVYAFGIAPRAYVLRQAYLSVELLRPKVAADIRFGKIHVGHSTNGAVVVTGEVKTPADLDALKQLIEKLNPPTKPIIDVDAPSNAR